jgi:hypothetical protein
VGVLVGARAGMAPEMEVGVEVKVDSGVEVGVGLEMEVEVGVAPGMGVEEGVGVEVEVSGEWVVLTLTEIHEET